MVNFCIPKIKISDYYKKSSFEINNKKIVKKLFKHVKKLLNKKNKSKCKLAKGAYINLTKDEMKKIFKPKNKYTKIYKENFVFLKKEYKEMLKSLIKLLQILESNDILTNKKLNNIGNLLHKLINKLKINCNYYYLTCLFSFIQLKIKSNISKLQQIK